MEETSRVLWQVDTHFPWEGVTVCPPLAFERNQRAGSASAKASCIE